MKLEEGEFINMGTFSEYKFNTQARTLENDAYTLLGRLLEAYRKQ